MSGRKCKNCGSSDIEVDPARGDAVCTNCGSVLEDSIIVAEVQFEEGTHGTSNAIGQFVSADSKGGATKFGASFHVAGVGTESRELTLRQARNGISSLCNQLGLNQHCIDTACSFFKMALSRNLTRGRRSTHVNAACVYLTCRTEGTAHLLIDISDVLQICCYELGRTYLKLSQALCINVPSVDPCLYILRFAGKLEFGAKTQQVANTALRLVQRMKRDSIHSGRRPSGLCGAALLIAARLHEFNRSTSDIVKIVKVHETTLRKRLVEFGDTPSSALTLDEFMTVDLEEEQDPPSFKAARKKDKERLQKVLDEETEVISDLQKQIETQLEKDKKRKVAINSKCDAKVEEKFIQQSTLDTIHKIMEESVDDPSISGFVEPLGPNIASMGLANSLEDTSNALQTDTGGDLSLDMTFDGIDDAEIDTYIMSEAEFENKQDLWRKVNAAYLEEMKIKEEKLQKEREEGKPEKKRKRTTRKKAGISANSAGEAIEKILQEKKISSKINYDVLKTLTSNSSQNEATVKEETTVVEHTPKKQKISAVVSSPSIQTKKTEKKKNTTVSGLPFIETPVKPKTEGEPVKKEEVFSEEEVEDYFEEEQQPDESIGVLEMLKQHRENEGDADEFEYGSGFDEDY